MIMIQTYKKQNYFDSGNDLGDNEANVFFFFFLRRCNHKLKDEKNKRKNTYTYIQVYWILQINQPTHAPNSQIVFTQQFINLQTFT